MTQIEFFKAREIARTQILSELTEERTATTVAAAQLIAEGHDPKKVWSAHDKVVEIIGQQIGTVLIAGTKVEERN
jgi:hypothetical protein